jgi:NTE family protein
MSNMPLVSENTRLALVIGSGSVKCAAALGLMKVLEREKIVVNLVVGCSGGALYAASIALGWPVEATIDKTLSLWTRRVTEKRSKKAVLQIVLPGLFHFDERFGLIDDSRLNRQLHEAFGEASFADTHIPLHIAATDFFDGEQVVLSNGLIWEAIRASLSIPYIFPPYRVAGRALMDGYQSDPLPVGIAIKEGADIILAMGFESPYQERITSLMRYNFQISSVTSNNLLKTNFAFHNLAHHSEIIPILPEFSQRIRLFDTDKIPYIIDEGEKAAEMALPYLRRLLGDPGVSA